MAAVVALCSCRGTAGAQALRDNFWVPNGTVNAIGVSGYTVYLGGKFTKVGPPTGSFVAVDPASGQANPPYPLVAGTVTAAASDGHGGWYIGGYFTSVGGVPRANLAHVDSSGAVTPWNPGTDFPIDCLALDDATGLVYVGGYYHAIGGQPRAGLAAVDGVTGVPTSWNPNPSTSAVAGLVRIFSIALYGSTVYVGGEFTAIGGQARNNLASVDIASGLATGWDPDVDRPVFTMTLRVSVFYPFVVTLYIGGYFNYVGGQVRNFIASVDGDTGAPSGWQPDADGAVRSLLVTGGFTPRQAITVYAGGDFSRLGAQTRRHAGAVNAAGLATSWFPDPDGPVFALAGGNGAIYLGGGFSTAGGQPRTNLAAVDPATGVATSWNPGPDSYPLVIVTASNAVMVGGQFTSVGGVARNNLAALDAVTGHPTDWDPNANGAVHALLVNGGSVYAGGEFTNIGGQPRGFAAALDPGSGAASAWDPEPNATVWALAARSIGNGRSLIYLGGEFTAAGGQTRYRLAAMDDAPVPQLSSWSPFVNGAVYALTVNGSRIYAGGGFAGAIMALNWDGSNNYAFSPNPPANTIVRAIATSGARVYAGGAFHYIGNRYRDNLAELDTTGHATTLDPYAGDQVYSLLLDGPTLYVGGVFSSLGLESREGIGAFDLATGQVEPFAPVPGYGAYAMAKAGGALYIGGDVRFLGSVYHANLGAFMFSTAGVAGGPGAAESPRLRLTSNPFRDRLGMAFGLAEAGSAEVCIFDALGRLVRSLPQGTLAPGEHTAVWDGRDDHGNGVSAGVYFLRVRSGSTRMSAKVLRLE